MTGLVDDLPSPAFVSESSVKTRKYPLTLEWINPSSSSDATASNGWIGCHSAKANAMVDSLLQQKLIPQLSSYNEIRKEVKYGSDGKSRVDFVLTNTDTKDCIYVEVKSVTLAAEYTTTSNTTTTTTTTNTSGKIAVFPDTVSTRSQKHMKELTAIAKNNNNITNGGGGSKKAAVVFLIQRKDCIAFAPCHLKDPEYGRLVVEAAEAGVLLLPIAVGLNVEESRVELVDVGVPVDLMFGMPL
jgi:sugar fermentation stimulation protein A